MKRHKHSLSHYNLHTFDMGQLIPISWFEALPGDSIRMSTSALLRVSPLLSPVMHPVTVRLHHWFVPNRIMWDQWEEFITGRETTEPPPFMAFQPTPKSLPDYMGIGPYSSEITHSFSLFPFIAYNKIFNEFYRDQDLTDEVAEDNMVVQNVAWEKDYFTAARNSPQQGDAVTLPFGTRADVRGIGIRQGDAFTNTGQAVNESNGETVTYADSQDTQDGTNIFEIEENPLAPGYPNIWADLSTATAVDVNTVRLMFALQRYKEARAQYGSRYTEYLRYLGVRSSDARLQRPEYLGGGKATISFSEVLRTGNSDGEIDDAPIGQMAGHGIAAVKSRRWVKFFEEHGIVITMASVRPRSMYVNGMHRSFSRETKEDYWQKELELIGQQQVMDKEVYLPGAQADGVFGWQDRYSEYRHLPSYVTSEFRNVLNDWHLGRIFGSQPALNDDFVKCVPSKRIHAEQTQNSLWGMFSHHVQARRLVGHKTIGRIL